MRETGMQSAFPGSGNDKQKGKVLHIYPGGAGLNNSECLNILGTFCGKRDVEKLTQNALFEKYGIRQADVMVLFGGSILCGGDLLADAMRKRVAKKYVIAGGAGHTTDTLRKNVHFEYPDMETAGKPEAELFAAYIDKKYGMSPIIVTLPSFLIQKRRN